jgi:lipoprotein NlpI
MPTQLTSAETQFDMNKWPAPLIRLYRDEPTTIFAYADNADVYIKKRQVCEAYFYTGKLELLRGNREEATRLFRSAAADCPKDSIELAAARAELKAIDARP